MSNKFIIIIIFFKTKLKRCLVYLFSTCINALYATNGGAPQTPAIVRVRTDNQRGAYVTCKIA